MEENMENKNEDCSCCGPSTETSNLEEVVSGNAFVLNTLIDLLIEKNVFTEEEFTKKLEDSQKEIIESMDDNSDEEPEEEN